MPSFEIFAISFLKFYAFFLNLADFHITHLDVNIKSSPTIEKLSWSNIENSEFYISTPTDTRWSLTKSAKKLAASTKKTINDKEIGGEE